MNVYEQIQRPFARVFSSQIAMILILSTLLWATGLPLYVVRADASQLTNISDTLTDSNLAVTTKHVIRFTMGSTTIPAGGTIKIQFDAAGSNFSEAFSSATSTDITATGMNVVSNAGACSGTASEVYPVGNYNNGTDENITFTVCPTDSISTGSKVISIGTSTALITNPSSTGSYRITVTGSNGDYGDTRVAVLPNVLVTASVDTSFTFTVTGIATSTAVNGDTGTTGSTTATVMAFNTLAPGVPKIMGQHLAVTTNAANGFSVTVVENQNLTSATGADIDLFKDGATTSVPTAWTSPTNVLGNEWTYGHIGVTSEDSTLSAGDEFGTALYAGNFNTARQVFYNNGPSDGTTANIGSTNVAFKVEIGTLQEAGNDYTNTLTYVATPTF